MKRLSAFTLAIGLSIFLSSSGAPAWAQDVAQADSATSVVVNPPPPKTRLQALAEQKGALVIGGYTDIGTVQREDGGFIRITAAEFTNSSSAKREDGLLVTIRQTEGGARETRSYIDDDEVDALLASLDAMGKLDKTVTAMNDFDCRFRTRGDLEIANVNVNGVRQVSLHGVEIISSSGQELWASTAFPLARLAEFSQYLTAGKQALDKAKANK